MSRAKSDQQVRIQRLRQLAYWLDESIEIPGIRYRIGWDSLIGLIPVVGDGLMLVVSLFIVIEGVRLKVPASVIGRLLLNILVESIVGSVPVLGDLFDMAWKANRRNVRLLENYEASPRKVRHENQAFWWVIVGAVVLALGAFVWLVVVVFQHLFQLL